MYLSLIECKRHLLLEIQIRKLFIRLVLFAQLQKGASLFHKTGFRKVLHGSGRDAKPNFLHRSKLKSESIAIGGFQIFVGTDGITEPLIF